MINFKGISFSSAFTAHRKGMILNAQNIIDKKCIEYLEHYVPIAQEKYQNHGKMSKSHKVEKAGVIINTEPKARREYYTNKGFSAPQRGKLWFERMKADHKEDILKAVKK